MFLLFWLKLNAYQPKINSSYLICWFKLFFFFLIYSLVTKNFLLFKTVFKYLFLKNVYLVGKSPEINICLTRRFLQWLTLIILELFNYNLHVPLIEFIKTAFDFNISEFSFCIEYFCIKLLYWFLAFSSNYCSFITLEIHLKLVMGFLNFLLYYFAIFFSASFNQKIQYLRQFTYHAKKTSLECKKNPRKFSFGSCESFWCIYILAIFISYNPFILY